MKVELINAYSLSNIGDVAIAYTLTQLTSPHETILKKCKLISANISIPGLSLSQEAGDIRISVGGDIFNNARPSFFTKRFVDNILQLRYQPKKTILFGQTIPKSCQGQAMNLLGYTLKKIKHVTVRDEFSYRLLKNRKIPVNLSFDTAFAIQICTEPIEKIVNDWLSELEIDNLDKLACFSLREFDALYPHDKKFIVRIASIIQELENRGWICAILIQSIDQHNINNDLLIANQFKNKFPRLKIINPFLLPSIHPIECYAYLIKQAGIVVSVRYHAAIFRLLGGRQPYNLFYSIKGEDLNNRLGLTGQSIDYSEHDIQTIEKTANYIFNPTPIAEKVKADFAFAWSQLLDN